MKRAAILIMTVWPALFAHAQTPRPERLEGCSDAILFTAEHYDLASLPGGRGGSVDWIHCASPQNVFTAGGASYAVGDSRWSFAKAGASLQMRSDVWLSGDVNVGVGHGAAGDFDYLNLHDGITVKAAERLFVKTEHQYIRIADQHGNVVKLAGVFMPWPSVLVEIAGLRSAGGNLGTRSYSSRIDWVDARGRIFIGGAHGHTTPQAVDIVTGARLPDSTTREWFAGAAIPVWGGELSVSIDEQRTEGSRRRTLSVSLRWPLP